LHPYATDSTERKIVPPFLAIAAIIAAWVLPKTASVVGVSLPWWVDTPSVMGFYGLFHAAFDRWIWKVGLLRAIGVIQVPDLNGRWNFRIASTFRKTEVEATVAIRQTWRTIQIRLETAQSRSSSQIASILTDDPNEFVLDYEFLNTPKQGAAVATMHMHRGSAEIRFEKNGAVARGEGEYYSGRDRENQGQINVLRR
jgi:hypothetical protein